MSHFAALALGLLDLEEAGPTFLSLAGMALTLVVALWLQRDFASGERSQ